MTKHKLGEQYNKLEESIARIAGYIALEVVPIYEVRSLPGIRTLEMQEGDIVRNSLNLKAFTFRNEI